MSRRRGDLPSSASPPRAARRGGRCLKARIGFATPATGRSLPRRRRARWSDKHIGEARHRRSRRAGAKRHRSRRQHPCQQGLSAPCRRRPDRARFGDRQRTGAAMSDDSAEIAVTVNGTPYRRSVESRLLLSDFLRHDLLLAGTHVGCEHGVCGACTVIRRRRAGPLVPDVRGASQRPRASRRWKGSRRIRSICIRCRNRCATATACNAATARRAFS